MKTEIKYKQTETIETEFEPTRVNIKFQSIEFILPDGTKKKAIPTGDNNYAIIEGDKLRFASPLEFITTF